MAEGVGTAAEMRALRTVDSDRMQGSFICDPLPLGQLRGFLDSLPQLRQMHLSSIGARGPARPAL
jgi:EAL domain-containing protein (putative c-di-GMP-specific phosphodiesterase class I)